MENEKEDEKQGGSEHKKQCGKTENFPSSLFVHEPWPVIRDILERRFSEMWNDATPVDIDNMSDVGNEDTKGDKRRIEEE